MSLPRVLPVVLLLGLSACSVRDAACGSPPPPNFVEIPEPGAARVQTPGMDATFHIAFLGDSLTAGLGLVADQAYPAQVQALLAAEGYHVEAVNAGVSGDTSAGGLRRVEQLLDGSVRVLVVALGANDALRGLTVQQTHDNLAQIIDIALGRGVAVLLCGMEGPTNLGTDYRDAFRAVYFDLLREYQGRIAYVPFLLEGVAGNPALNQADGTHPTAEGSKVIAETLRPKLRDLVDRLGGGD